MNNLCFHIGYHKTASTWLQLHGFHFHPELHFLNATSVQFERQWYSTVVESGDFFLNVSDARELLAKGIYGSAGKNGFIVSDESMSGHVYSGWNTKRNADRLHEIIPNAKIFFVIRRQSDYIRSAYSNYVFQGGSLRFKHWIKDTEYPAKSIVEKLQYHFLIEYYMDLFGKKNIFVVPYEFIREKGMLEFLNLFYAFMGVKPLNELPVSRSGANVTFSPITVRLERLFNGIRGGNSLNQIRFFKLLDYLIKKIPQVRFNQTLALKLDEEFILSNRKTAELIGFELSNYGYKI